MEMPSPDAQQTGSLCATSESIFMLCFLIQTDDLSGENCEVTQFFGLGFSDFFCLVLFLMMFSHN